MGFFGTYLFEGGRWTASDTGREAAQPWLFLNIYDSDIATIMYCPCGPATGMAFLGVTPRSYFDTTSASPPTDTALESAGLAAWWAGLNPETTAAEQAEKAAQLRQLLAADCDPYDLASPIVFGDERPRVEVLARDLLTALGLPLPDELVQPAGTSSRP